MALLKNVNKGLVTVSVMGFGLECNIFFVNFFALSLHVIITNDNEAEHQKNQNPQPKHHGQLLMGFN